MVARTPGEDTMDLNEARIQAENYGPGYGTAYGPGYGPDHVSGYGSELTRLDECFSDPASGLNHLAVSEPGPVLLLGAPGVGKGTQAEKLAELWGVPTISTGEILRTNVANGTPLGIQANRIMKLGGLVPDQIMNGMVADRLGFADTASGFILDGFPRTVHQAEWLDRYLSDHREGAVLGIISMHMDFRGIVERVVNRRVCPLCKTVYNTHLMPPVRVGRCDKDDVELIQRSDDRLEVFETRLEVFKRETEPLIEYFRGRALFIEVDAEKPPSSVTRDIVAGLVSSRMQIAR
jgi:adenylate kinase